MTCVWGQMPTGVEALCRDLVQKNFLLGEGKKKKARTTGAIFLIKMWRRKPSTFGVSQDSPATKPVETVKAFLTLILFFHCLSLVLHSQTHEYLKYGFVVINNSTTCDCVIFHNMSVREISLLDLKQENWNTRISKLCTSPSLPGHYLPVPRPFPTKIKGLERPKRATGESCPVLNPSGRRQTRGNCPGFPLAFQHTHSLQRGRAPCLLPMQVTAEQDIWH